MAVATLIGHVLTSVEKTPRAAIGWFLDSVNSRADRLRWDLTVINFLAIATSVFRQIGVGIEMDHGDGALAPIYKKDLGTTITLTDSLDAYGVKTLAFERFGDDQAPIKSTMLRGMRAVKMTVYRGANGAIGSRTLFEGFIREADYDCYPPLGKIDCLDAALPFVDKPMVYSKAAGSGLSREEILLDIFAAHAIPVGTLDLPVSDGFRGGQVFKEINEGGEMSLLSWLVEWLVPIGCKPQWRDGQINIRRFDTSADPVRTLTTRDIRLLSVAPPSTNGPNAASFSSQIFAKDTFSGRRTLPPEIKSTSGIYAPATATLRQDTNGTTTPLSVAIPAESREISRTITTSVFDGGTLVEQYFVEYGWYAPRACNRQQDGAGAISHNSTFPVYQFPDGTWRTTQQEDFQPIRGRNLTRTFDDDGFLISETEYVFRFAEVEAPRGTLNAGTGAEQPTAGALLTEDGIAWQGGKEVFYAEKNTIQYNDNGAGGLSQIVRLVSSDLRTTYTFASSGPYSGATIYYFGPTANKQYGASVGTNATLASQTTNFTPIDEQSHKQRTDTVLVTNYFPKTFQFPGAGGFDVVVAGPVPYIEQRTSPQTAQPATVTVYDDVRSKLARDSTVIDGRSNDYCETDGELRTAAIEHVRFLGSLTVTITMDVDLICESGKVVDLAAHPKFNHETVSLLVEQAEITINGATGENTQTLTCRYYGPELQAA